MMQNPPNNPPSNQPAQPARCPLCGLSDRSDTRCPCSESNFDELVGTVLNDKYTVQQLLGRGSWSRVYLGLDNILNRFVAIKVLRTELRNEPISVARFTREAQALAVLNHPNIVTIFDFGVTDHEAPYLVLEQVEGQTLTDVITKAGGRLTPHAAIPLFIQCADALSAGHVKGVIHRDINPDNIVVRQSSSGQHIKILDYGLCKMIYEEFDPKLTEKGVALATANYMSPEMTSGKAIDGRADIYSLGCVMYQTLSGTPPFQADSYLDIVKNHLSKPVPAFDPALSVPKPLAEIVYRCLEKDPAKRYQSADELVLALNSQRSLQSSTPRSSSDTSGSADAITASATAKPLLIALTIACVILAIALTFMLVSRTS